MNRYLLRHSLIALAVILAALLLSFGLTRSSLALFRAPLPSYSVLPPFSLVEKSGNPLGNRDLLGKIWVADFIYTTCPGPCLDLTRRFQEVQKRLPAGLDCRFVSFSVDPANDTPAVLRTYAESHEADANRWLFVTGNKAAMYDLFENGFRLTVMENNDPKASVDGKFIHTTKWVLVDRQGKIRGYYDGLTAEAPAKLLSDLKRLNRE